MNGYGTVWHALSITIFAAATEAVEFALNQLDAGGTEINQLRKEKSADVTVIGYFETRIADEAVNETLAECLRIYGFDKNVVRETDWREIENTDWLKEWKKHWKPTVIGNFVIAPSWETIEDTDRIVIRIEPNMAFGTGTHETTKLCLKAIEENYRAGQSFLDVGTGTGILAIAAAKIFATEYTEITDVARLKLKKASENPVVSVAKITGFDTDVDSVKIAKENAATNGVASKIDFYNGPISVQTPAFDFVCANLTIDVILPVLSLLVEKTKNTLVLSGILLEQEDEITTALEKFPARAFVIERDGEWISVVVKK